MPKCELIRSQLADYLLGGLPRRARSRVAAHLASCPGCRAELAALARTGDLLRQVAPAPAPPALWESINREILARPRHPVRPALRWAWGLAMAVILLVVIVAGSFSLRSPLTPAPVSVVATAQADEEMQATIEAHLSAVWDSPLADEAAVGLRLASLEVEE